MASSNQPRSLSTLTISLQQINDFLLGMSPVQSTLVTHRFELLAERVRFSLENEDGYPEGTHQLLKRLCMSLQAITPAVQRMERRGRYSATEFRMSVKDGVCDAEDVLDKLQYRIWQQEEADVGRQVPTCWECFRLFYSHQDHQDHQALDELCEVVDRFVELERECMHYTIHIPEEEEPYGGGDHRMKRWFRENQPVVMNPGETIKLVGRAREKEAILDFLMGRPAGSGAEGTSSQGNSNNVQVLPIVGEGGVGKTALAQWAYYQPIVERHFHLRAWVHVTDQSVLERVVGEIVPSATSIELPQNSHDLDSMRLTLEKALRGRRFLIVLDAWEGGVRDWEVLHKALKVGEEGSRLLITTRVMTAETTGTVSPICLARLRMEDCWSLLRLHAFGHECGDDSIPPEMEHIAWEIAIKLGGLPLVVKMLGSLLSSNFDISYWHHILSNKLWDIVDANQSESAILLCYEELPRDLKPCIAYCSLFPRNSGFEEDTLVRFWIAVGYVPSSKETRQEDIGRQYFDELTQRSFFQKKQYQDGYGIHDILHDHAIWVSRRECYVFEDHPNSIIPGQVHHLRIRADNLNKIRHYPRKRVRSLIIYGRHRIDGFADILKMFKGLRVLVLADLNIKLLPECIGGLIHLRFLILHKLDVRELPESVCRLYLLQGLDVTDCKNLLTMPSGLRDLVNLRYLRQ